MGKYRSMARILWPLYLIVAIALTGCVKYDVGVNFQSQTYGEMVQRVQISDRLHDFSQVVAEQWLESLQERTRKLRGKTQRISERELLVTIPFYNGADLASKFNEFFNPANPQTPPEDETLPQLTSELNLAQNNFWVAIRNHLEMEVDLRSLAVLSSEGNVLVSPGSLFNLQFALTTPWDAQPITQAENSLTPVPDPENHQLVWTLEAGEINHLEVIFWVPSPIGIGALIILAAIFGGMTLKDWFPQKG
ncbi:DUF3153 domain-containing protein [Roseofilum capinflatum]|uniref:DUF3153 domain-containing protein n=1 Tax=Roseofilum capinflatum BLCC-M114 TaxID=3022440 RepID=A0ABT7B9V3_9CYAN|nr:DUF3153 domain-containing protein [Roseofilum capinflatum]MDJ1175950.1 DUF3153 domain-containing protein [Roseofilum capinflatum BLCC-M114]